MALFDRGVRLGSMCVEHLRTFFLFIVSSHTPQMFVSFYLFITSSSDVPECYSDVLAHSLDVSENSSGVFLEIQQHCSCWESFGFVRNH